MIAINYGDEFRTAVTEGDADPYIRIRMVAGDTYLYGTADRWPKNWVTYIVNSLLETIPLIADGKKSVVTNHNGPSYFVLEPEDDSTVRITHVLRYEGVNDPNQRLPEAKEAVIKISSVAEESIQAGEELLDRIEACNPELTDHSDIQLLRSNLNEARAVTDRI